MILEFQSSQCNICGCVQSPTKICRVCKSVSISTGLKLGWVVVLSIFVSAVVSLITDICLGLG